MPLLATITRFGGQILDRPLRERREANAGAVADAGRNQHVDNDPDIASWNLGL